MADITVADLPNKPELLDSDQLVVDDGAESFRVSYAQLTNALKQSLKIEELQQDVRQNTEDLHDKADTDLANVTATSGLRRLVEVYQSGTSWYKVFNEFDSSTGAFIGKWCEQGGRTSASSQTVYFLKSFINTDYTITGGLIIGNYTATYEHLNMTDLSTSSFYFNCFDGYRLMWRASGYIS